MKNKINNWWLSLIKGIVLIALGIYIFGHPVDALLGVAYFIGLALLFTGLLIVIMAISARKEITNWGWRLTEGLLDIVFAYILLTNPGVTAVILPFILGIWTIVSGLMLFADAFQAKDDGVSHWWIGLFAGFGAIIVGYFITTNEGFGAFSITFWIGLGFVLLGLVNVFLSLKAKSIKNIVD